MNLFHLRYFVQLAHTQHYTQAAQQLSISQPSLSHAIANLEQELGVALFEKSGRNTVLTRFGEEFLSGVEASLAILDDSVQSLQRSARGEGLVRLGLLRTLGTMFVPKLAADFLRQNPDKDIRFTFHSGVTLGLAEDLAARKLDLVFSSIPPAQFDFSAVPVARQDLVLIVPRGHPLSTHRTVDLVDTLPYPQIFFNHAAGLRSLIDNLFHQIGATPQIAYETDEDQVIAGLVANGFGIAVVPYMDLLHQLNVNILQISNPTWERNFYLVHDEKVFLSPAVQSFRQFVLDHRAL